MALGERLKYLREKQTPKIYQKELADAIGVSRQAITMWETGQRIPETLTLEKIADFFGVTTDYLLGRTDNPTPPQAKKETPSHEEYVLSVKTLGDAAIRIAELLSQDLIDEKEYLRLNELAVKKFPLRPAKGTSKAAHLEVNIPGTGVFEDKASEK